MDDLAAIRARIPAYADYGDLDARHQSDKQVRAWLGEALADARERLKPEAALAERLEGLILRCEFSDQRAIRAADHARFVDTLLQRIHALDRELIDCADHIRGIGEAAALGPALDDAARIFDERLGALAEAPSR